MPPPKRVTPGSFLPILIFIAALSLFHFFPHDPYKQIGPDLLKAKEWGPYHLSDWSTGPALTEISEDGVIGTQTTENGRGWISCRLDGIRPGDLFRLRGEASATDIVRGKYSWQAGRTTLAYYDMNNKAHWNYPTTAGLMTGTRNWKEFELLSEAQPYAHYAKLWIGNAGKSGRYEVRNLSLVPVRLKRSVPFYYWSAVLVLIGLGGWYSYRLTLFTRAWGWLVILISICILTGVLLPEKAVDATPKITAGVIEKSVHKMAQAAPVQKVVPALKPEAKSRPEWVQRKDRIIKWVKGLNVHNLGHFGLFLLFGFACGLCFLRGTIPNRLYTLHHQDAAKVLYLLTSVLLFTITAELIQAVALTRTLDIHDWVLNIYGASSGLLLFVLLHLGQHPLRRLLKLVAK